MVLTEFIKDEIRQKYISGVVKKDLAEQYCVSLTTIASVFTAKSKAKKRKSRRRDI